MKGKAEELLRTTKKYVNLKWEMSFLHLSLMLWNVEHYHKVCYPRDSHGSCLGFYNGVGACRCCSPSFLSLLTLSKDMMAPLLPCWKGQKHQRIQLWQKWIKERVPATIYLLTTRFVREKKHTPIVSWRHSYLTRLSN